MTCTFPQDIVENVIEHPILRNEMKTIKACSLVCSSWVWGSRRRLFRDVPVRLVSGDRVQSFAELLASPNCTIGPHIRRVEIKMKNYSPEAVISQAIQLIARHSLACHHLCISPFSWTRLAIPTRNTFLRLSKVDHLELSETQCGSLKELMVIISCFPQLLSLTLSHGTFDRSDLPATIPLPSSLTQLSLTGSGFTPLLPYIAKTTLPNLCQVGISLLPSDFSSISGWLKQHAPTLQRVKINAEKATEWNVGSTMIDAWSLLDFSEFRSLETLLFDFDPYKTGIDHFRVVATILRQIPSTSLKSLTVFCTANLHHHHMAVLEILQDWVDTLSEDRFARMHFTKTLYARIARQVIYISQSQIYCDSINDFDGRWIKWLLNKLRDPHHFLDITNT